MSKQILAAVVLAASIAPPFVHAGDEVDYSAPYLVVEDGELVTKYPPKEHEAATPEAGATASEAAQQPQAGLVRGLAWLVIVSVTAAVIALLILKKRAGRRS